MCVLRRYDSAFLRIAINLPSQVASLPTRLQAKRQVPSLSEMTPEFPYPYP